MPINFMRVKSYQTSTKLFFPEKRVLSEVGDQTLISAAESAAEHEPTQQPSAGYVTTVRCVNQQAAPLAA